MSGNRWASVLHPDQETAAVETAQPEAAAVDPVDVLVGTPAPQPGVEAPRDGRLGRFAAVDSGPWWLGVHGGAGESTMADLLGGHTCDHRWPDTGDSEARAAVFLVARQSAHGLEAAKRAARDWAAGSHPTIDLLGLVVVAGAPGKPAKTLRSQTRVVGGGVPRTWVVPWIESLHTEGRTDDLPRSCVPVLTAIGEVIEREREDRKWTS